jgi:uncharacterized protein with PhoU and TrkA domain
MVSHLMVSLSAYCLIFNNAVSIAIMARRLEDALVKLWGKLRRSAPLRD